MFRTLRFYHSFFKFLSTPSSRRATQDQIHHLWRGGHFYPRPPRGGRPKPFCNLVCRDQFLSTPSARRATAAVNAYQRGGIFLSTPSARRATFRPDVPSPEMHDFYPRPPRGGRHGQPTNRSTNRPISIHALREEGDISGNFPRKSPQKISIHALREEGDPRRSTYAATGEGFLSTPSARRATEARRPRGREGRISIHALREEGDNNLNKSSRPLEISIHALREEGDLLGAILNTSIVDFYPRPPRGGRQRRGSSPGVFIIFLSTPSARRATAARSGCRWVLSDFYPRPPRGGRLIPACF